MPHDPTELRQPGGDRRSEPKSGREVFPEHHSAAGKLTFQTAGRHSPTKNYDTAGFYPAFMGRKLQTNAFQEKADS
ncbi:UNVERIFIED_CONTAM: hypothetical protein K2H54_023523 [Gekko kuhli]